MSNKFNFTKAAIESLNIPKEKRQTYHDLKIVGLQIRVTPTGVKTFSVFRRVKNGSPIRITLGKYPDLTIEQARRQASEINAQIANKENPIDAIRKNKQELTLDELFKEYLNRCGNFNKRPDKARSNYRLYLSSIGKKKLSTIRHEEVSRLHSRLGQERGFVTANIALKLLHVMFNKAINEWRIWEGINPAHGIKKFPEKSRDRFLQEDELPRFFDTLNKEKNLTIRDFILISLLTGARKSNVLSMRWEDINFERNEWRIEDTKNGIPQSIPLTAEAIKILRDRLELNQNGYVFGGVGKSGHLAEPKSGWKRILKDANIKDLRIHDLRRTLGSWQAKTGASLPIIGKSLNHQSLQSTSVYARLDLNPVRSSMNTAVDAMLKVGNYNKN